ncbi:MAG: hypothetical protein V2A77_06790, partial [Pseudomonadota bacterium]
VSLAVESVPVALFAVDAVRGPRGDVLSIAIYNSRAGFVARRLRQMWEKDEGRGQGGPPGLEPSPQPQPEGPLLKKRGPTEALYEQRWLSQRLVSVAKGREDVFSAAAAPR